MLHVSRLSCTSRGFSLWWKTARQSMEAANPIRFCNVPDNRDRTQCMRRVFVSACQPGGNQDHHLYRRRSSRAQGVGAARSSLYERVRRLWTPHVRCDGHLHRCDWWRTAPASHLSRDRLKGYSYLGDVDPRPRSRNSNCNGFYRRGCCVSDVHRYRSIAVKKAGEIG